MTHDIKIYIDTINKLSQEEGCDKVYDDLTGAFRNLRNICAKSPHLQNEIVLDHDILNSTHKILQNFIYSGCRSDSDHLCLHIGLQFVANLLVNNHGLQEVIWKQYKDLFISCLKFNNCKVQNCASMILYNVCLGHPEFLTILNDIFEDIIILTENENISEFPLYLTHLFILKTSHLKCLYESLKMESRLLVMDIIQNLLKTEETPINSELITFFVQKFLDYSDDILQILTSSGPSLKALEVVKMLDLLVTFSGSNENNVQLLQTPNSLLINCITILKKVHILSKESNSSFSAIQKLSELNEIEKNLSIQEEPAYGFKSSLIRLIGNLCWKNSSNQDIVRDMECIPVILDCCSIDGRNPFITQWAIFALRNICEKNTENQKYIAAIPRSGVMDIDKLNEIGITLNKDANGSKLTISPLEFK